MYLISAEYGTSAEYRCRWIGKVAWPEAVRCKGMPPNWLVSTNSIPEAEDEWGLLDELEDIIWCGSIALSEISDEAKSNDNENNLEEVHGCQAIIERTKGGSGDGMRNNKES